MDRNLYITHLNNLKIMLWGLQSVYNFSLIDRAIPRFNEEVESY